jgi:hypothetical protein
MKSHVSPLPSKQTTLRRKRPMATRPPLLRFDASTLPAFEAVLVGELTPPKQIADDAALLAAYLEARETLTADVRRFWGGIARRTGGEAADPAAIADLADVLRETGEAYKRDAELARTPDWATAAEARASLYASAFRALRRLVRGGSAA